MTVLSKNLHPSTSHHIEGARRIPSLENDGSFGNLTKMEPFNDLSSLLGGEG